MTESRGGLTRPLFIVCALFVGCSSQDASTGPTGGGGNGGGQTGGSSGAGGSPGTGGIAGTSGGASGSSGSTAAGAGGTAGTGGAVSGGAGGAGGSPGTGGSSGGSSGSGGSPGTGGSGGTGGSSSAAVDSGTGPVADVTMEPHTVSVTGGSVFNLTDDFFDDGLVPPSPLANFGFHSPIITIARADGSLDVAWLDYAGGKGKPFGLGTAAMINITHVDPALATGTTTATGISSYRLLGFTADPAGAFYLAYTADHPFKDSVAGSANNINGNELRIAKASTPSFTPKTWDALVFGDMDNTKDLSKGDPGGAGSGVLGFDTTNQRLVLYVAHSMAWGDNGTRHQAGYFRLRDPATGAEVVQNGGSSMNMGAGWFYSHNFDQRMIVEPGKYYLLAHGDAYARQLGFAAWSPAGYMKNSSDFDKPYFTITGNVGDNTTNAETGQMVHLASGQFAIVHTSSQGRTARDVRIVLADGATGVVASEAWLTTNTGKIQASMPKVEVLGDKLLVTYGLWDSTSRTNRTFKWYVMLLDQTLKPVTSPKEVTGVEFVKPAPMVRFTGGPNAGSVGWVSGNATHTLSVNVVRPVR